MIDDSFSVFNNLRFHPENVIGFILNTEVQILGTILIHPLYYARKLIQIGYEPLPPIQARLYFIGPPVLVLPNMFSYIKHIYSIDGLTGCYRGLIAVLCYKVSVSIIYHVIVLKNSDAIEDALNNNSYFTLVMWDMLALTAAIFFSHPFYVLSNRQMASFVGHETKYNGILKGLYEIAIDEGLSGWFSGFVPILVADIIEILIFYMLYFVIHKYIFVNTGREFRKVISIGCTCIATTLSYPYYVISVCMSVNGSQLVAGLPPFTPFFEHNWIKCHNYLSEKYQLQRGKSIFWRQFISPLLSE